MGYFTSLSKAETSSALHISELVVFIFGIVLVAGLVGELLTDDRRTTGTKWKALYRAFEIMVIVGVSGELIGDGGIFAFTEHLQTMSDHDVAELNRGTATLQWQLEMERQKRAQRMLTVEQKHVLVAQLNGRIRRINVVVQRDWESKAFALQLEIVFQDAGAKLGEYAMPPGEMLVAPGVMMYKPGGANNEDDLKGDPLYGALKKAGLFGGYTRNPIVSPNLLDPARLPADEYVVYVGQKPPW